MAPTLLIEYDVIRSTLRALRWQRLDRHRDPALEQSIVHALSALGAFRTPEGEQWLRRSAMPRVADPGRFLESARLELLLGAADLAEDVAVRDDLLAVAV